MVNALEVDPNDLIERAAEKLKDKDAIQPPEWAGYAKTGVHKERQPDREDWWFVRAAAVLRSVYKLGPIGTSKLRTKYGGRKDKGYQPEEFKEGSGSVIRNCLQQLEKAGMVRHVEKGSRKGRVVTSEGESFLDSMALNILEEHKN